MRKKIYGILESARDGDWYDILMLVAIPFGQVIRSKK